MTAAHAMVIQNQDRFAFISLPSGRASGRAKPRLSGFPKIAFAAENDLKKGGEARSTLHSPGKC
jgi:hypothetical protein